MPVAQYITYLSFALQMCVGAAFLFAVLPSRWPPVQGYLALVVLGWVSSVAADMFCQTIAQKALLVYPTMLLYVILIFRQTLGYKIIVYLVWQLVQLVVEPLGAVLFYDGGYSFSNESRGSVMRVYASLFGLVVAAVLWWLAFLVLRRTKKQKSPVSSWVVRRFLPFPMGQMLLVWCMLLLMLEESPQDVLPLYTLAMAVCIVADVYMFHNLVQVERKVQAEKELQEAEYTAFILRAEYENLTLSSQRVEKFRHDYKNMLSSAVQLLEQPDTQGQGLALLRSMSESISQPGALLCHNPVVNAVLTEKAAQCAQKGILFHCNVLLPEQLP